MPVSRIAVATFAITLALVVSGAALAAGGHKHNDGHKHGEGHDKTDVGHGHGAKHGGQFMEVGGHQGVEMVIDGQSIAFHITENDKPADLNGASFKAVIQTSAGVKMYPLAVEGSTLKTKLAAALPSGAKVVITGKDGHGHTLQARFVTK